MEIGLVRKIDIETEMQQSYLDYAMSTIVARALPDARDGLKPVHRRILYAMYDMGLRPNSAHKKSARVVGEVLGKYHPHGDSAVYDSMARMAQDFSMRLLLVDGQGNFGSVDGDAPAAMRYTEARLTLAAMDILTDIQKGTVDFVPNFDDTLTEPSVLPAALPNLLINGATGIAVGMATNIPPHNLAEVVDGCVYMLDNWSKLDDITVEDLMQFIKGPDFPTGGLILAPEREEEGLAAAYGTGRGRVTVQARAHIEEMSRGRERIIISELPYATNKSTLIERIATLAREGSVEGISDLRDESDRNGMRIVIELSKTAEPEKVLAALYRKTPMQGTFGIITLALVDGEPRMLSLKQALQVYLDHRQEIVRRRSQYDLDKAEQRAHILEGLRVALNNLDEVIDLIRKAADVDAARERLMKRFKLSEVQAQAILDMPLRRLAALERKKIEMEYKEVMGQIKELQELLKSPKKMRAVIAAELAKVKEAYGDRRRTQIVSLKAGKSSKSHVLTGDLVPDTQSWIAIDRKGLIARTPDGKSPNMTGWSKPLWMASASTRDTLYLVAEDGSAAAIPVHSLPESETPEGGVPYWTVSPLKEANTLAAIFSLPTRERRGEGWFVVTATRQGMVKKSSIEELPGASAQTFALARVNEGDRLGWVALSTGEQELLLVTAHGMSIRFSEEEVRPMGLVAAGVSGVKLKGEDELVGFSVLNPEYDVFLLASNGFAKRVKAAQFPRQGRYGQGVAAWKLPSGVQLAGFAHDKPNQQLVVHTHSYAPKLLRLDDAPLRSRVANGKDLVDLKDADRLTGFTAPWESPSGAASGKPAIAPPPKPARAKAAKPKTAKRKAAKSAAKAKTPARKAKKPATARKSPAKKKTSGRRK
ncbi:MAG: DNA gyrase subunit A [Anaerolineae bacterium]|nr:MAG: DNA gyrase subunit A [Anaerolineae bacterium]